MKLVIDTNLYVSALINANSRQRLDTILRNPDYTVLLNDTLLAELDEVIRRPRFQRYLTPIQIDRFMNLLLERTLRIPIVSMVQASPDPKDDFLLALCRDGQADYLLTGNKIDSLDLKQFDMTQILTLTEFLNRF